MEKSFVEHFLISSEYQLHRHVFMIMCYVNNISLAKYIYNTKFIDIEIIDEVLIRHVKNGTYHLIQWITIPKKFRRC